MFPTMQEKSAIKLDVIFGAVVVIHEPGCIAVQFISSWQSFAAQALMCDSLSPA